MVYTLGESLLDIIINSNDNVVTRPGGAMLNTAISLGRSGVDVSLISELGNDTTGEMIISYLQKNSVNTDFVRLYNDSKTSLALAFLDKDKKPKYSFYKTYPDIRSFKNVQSFRQGDIILFGSLYSLDKSVREDILKILHEIKSSKGLIIYDPNIRNAHHLENSETLNSVYENIKIADIIKGSDEDFANIFGYRDPADQSVAIREINNNALVIITQGSAGVFANYQNINTSIPAIKTNVVSTIGAGDAFSAGLIFALNKLKITHNNFESTIIRNIEDILTSGLKFSAKVCASLDNYIPTN